MFDSIFKICSMVAYDCPVRWTEVKDTHCCWSENWLKDVKIPSAKDFALILCGSRNMFV